MGVDSCQVRAAFTLSNKLGLSVRKDFKRVQNCISNTYYYAALLPRRGPHIASHSVCLSVCPSVCPSVPLSLPSSRRAT